MLATIPLVLASLCVCSAQLDTTALDKVLRSLVWMELGVRTTSRISVCQATRRIQLPQVAHPPMQKLALNANSAIPADNPCKRPDATLAMCATTTEADLPLTDPMAPEKEWQLQTLSTTAPLLDGRRATWSSTMEKSVCQENSVLKI